ncbi:N-acetylglucosamine kinase [Pollutibacter soli]|uniref:N-acetylglucosamine kinase n=1 Tax=Pollutibacter soli TaxID=3034157 RepID=UPI0030135187
MPVVKLIADSGSTKAEWCLVKGKSRKTILSHGISPYFLNKDQIIRLISEEVLPSIEKDKVDEVFYYGTGCLSKTNAAMVKSALKAVFPAAYIRVNHDLAGAAISVCGKGKGVACILGTGSNSCYYNGNKIVKNSPGLGYVLGDEGSGAYLGKKVLQYYLYNTFDDELRALFDAKYVTTQSEILDHVYKQPLANRYLASYAMFLAENRGHYMIENIIEDGINDFFFHHICKYRESWTSPIHFVGSIAFGFADVVETLCSNYEFKLGKISRNPMDGLVDYHIKYGRE